MSEKEKEEEEEDDETRRNARSMRCATFGQQHARQDGKVMMALVSTETKHAQHPNT